MLLSQELSAYLKILKNKKLGLAKGGSLENGRGR